MAGRKRDKLKKEAKYFLTDRASTLDSVVPPLVFVAVNWAGGLAIAMFISFIYSIILCVVRLVRRQSVSYAVGGLIFTLIAIAAAGYFGRAQAYFIPDIIQGYATAFICILSVVVAKPAAAYVSFAYHRWNLRWYWHPRIRPAYSEVSLVWGLLFGVRATVQYLVYQTGNTELLGLTGFVMGLPASTFVLLVSYVYGLWRLEKLDGPSVKEFESDAEPPWEGPEGF